MLKILPLCIRNEYFTVNTIKYPTRLAVLSYIYRFSIHKCMQTYVFTIKQIWWDHELLVPGPLWPDTTFAAIFDKHFLYTHTITGMLSSFFCFHFGRCRSGATTVDLRKDTDKNMNHKCVLTQPPALAVHAAVRPLLHWTHGHGGVFTLNMQERLTMWWWLCHQSECCVGMPTDQCIHPQQGKHITSTCYPTKMSSVNYRPKGDHLYSHIRTQLP